MRYRYMYIPHERRTVLVLAGQSTKMLCDLRGSGIGSSPREGDGVMVG
eukprot:COSAG02_NODE_7282_length_3086_cov_1.178775_7_plen_47_part_01